MPPERRNTTGTARMIGLLIVVAATLGTTRAHPTAGESGTSTAAAALPAAVQRLPLLPAANHHHQQAHRRVVDIHYGLTFARPLTTMAASAFQAGADGLPTAPASSSEAREEADGGAAPSNPIYFPAFRGRPPAPSPGTDDDNEVTFWPNFFAKYMSACYLCLCVMSGVQLLRTIVHKHKIRSFRFGFLLVCFLWTLLRVLFWFLVRLQTWPTWLSDLIYFLPNACQIATFSLLILFYAKLHHRHRWRFLRLRFLGFCVLANLAMVLLTLTFSILMDRVQQTQHDDPTSTDASNVKEFVYKMYFISSALFFGVLVALAVFYIHKLYSARGNTVGTSKQEVLVTSLIFVIFLSRCVWDLLAAFDSDSTLFRHQIWETTGSHVKLMNLATFLLLFVWEVIPTLMVIAYFRNIPNTSDSYCVGAWACFEQHAAVRTCLGRWPCNMPPEYFEPIDPASQASSSPHTGTGAGGSAEDSMDGGMNGRSGGGGGDGRVHGSHSGGGGPDYVAMDEDAGGSSSALPPGSFVRSSSLSHSQMYSNGSVGASSSSTGPPYGGRSFAAMHQHQAWNIGAGGTHALGTTPLRQPINHVADDLYGSPTWLNPTHPALHHLTPAAGTSVSSHAQQTGGVLGAHAAGSSGLAQSHIYAHGGARDPYEAEDDDLHDAYLPVHPYTQNQQSQAMQAQESIKLGGRPPLHSSARRPDA